MPTEQMFAYLVTYEYRVAGGIMWKRRFAELEHGPDAGAAVASVLPRVLRGAGVVAVRLNEVTRKPAPGRCEIVDADSHEIEYDISA